MEIDEARERVRSIEKNIRDILSNFEEITGLHVGEVELRRSADMTGNGNLYNVVIRTNLT